MAHMATMMPGKLTSAVTMSSEAADIAPGSMNPATSSTCTSVWPRKWSARLWASFGPDSMLCLCRWAKVTGQYAVVPPATNSLQKNSVTMMRKLNHSGYVDIMPTTSRKVTELASLSHLTSSLCKSRRSCLWLVSAMRLRVDTRARPWPAMAKKCGVSCRAAGLRRLKTKKSPAGRTAAASSQRQGPSSNSGIQMRRATADQSAPTRKDMPSAALQVPRSPAGTTSESMMTEQGTDRPPKKPVKKSRA
mmetsp:Transcript_61804/g.165354  ORF Transcript_61804/g.165354 Transcript_61804/m.165354 type:complete len:248 (+) Transcript_61804:476-1219(+)